MRSILLLTILSISLYASFIWAIVSFILFLVKDIPFNWFSVVAVVVSYVFIIFNIFRK